MIITTTLNAIREHKPCDDGWKKLLKHLGKTHADDEAFPMSVILDSNGLEDCLWALRTRPDLSSLWRLYAVDAAREVQHLMQDQRSKDALDVAERHALGLATDNDLEAACAAARRAANDGAGLAAWESAYGASWDAARHAARAVAYSASWDAARYASRSARLASWDAAMHTTCAAARGKQTRMLRQLLDTGERPDWKNGGAQ